MENMKKKPKIELDCTIEELIDDLAFYMREIGNFRNDGWVREGYMALAEETANEIQRRTNFDT